MRGKTKTRAAEPYPVLACRPAPPLPDPAEAARVAAEVNPANAVPYLTDPQQVAVLTSKYWGPAGWTCPSSSWTTRTPRRGG